MSYLQSKYIVDIVVHDEDFELIAARKYFRQGIFLLPELVFEQPAGQSLHVLLLLAAILLNVLDLQAVHARNLSNLESLVNQHFA